MKVPRLLVALLLPKILIWLGCGTEGHFYMHVTFALKINSKILRVFRVDFRSVNPKLPGGILATDGLENIIDVYWNGWYTPESLG